MLNHLRGRYGPAVALALLGLCPNVVLQTVFFLLNTSVAGDLGVSTSNVQVSESLASAAYATGAVVGAQLAQRFGQRRLFLTYQAVFVVGSLVTAAAPGLAVRHDHGSQYVSNAFQEELAFLGIESSPAFVRAPEGNGCAERFIRTVKENLLWLRRFETVEELRLALIDFKDRYNRTWIIERHGYRTPDQVRYDQLHPAALAA